MDALGAAGLLAWRGTAAMLAPGLRLLLRRRAARGKEVPVRLPARRGVDPAPRLRVLKVTEPPRRQAGKKVGSVEELVQTLTAEAKVI